MIAKALWLQDPIQESITSFCSEDENSKAVAGFKGEWLQAALDPMCTWLPSYFELSLDLPICQFGKFAPPVRVSIHGLCGTWGSWLTLAPSGFPESISSSTKLETTVHPGVFGE